MVREYFEQNVYEAFQQRIKYIFEEFDNIYISFSGGKDSGLLLNMVLEYQKANYPDKRIAVFHQDFEAQYTVTTEYVEKTFEKIQDEVEPYWVCLPMATRTALSNYQMYWYPWDDKKKESWVRPMPDKKYVINLENNPMTTYRYRMHQEDLAKQFGRWYRMSHGDRKTVCLLGMRADESLQRYSGFLNKKYGYNGTCWITRQFKDVWCASPMYDWSVQDVWHAYARFGYEYNRLYDLYYMAGLTVGQMRVASPFNDYSKDSLNLYRVIDPQIWVKLVGRVQGANFASIYGKTKAMGYRNVTLPPGHTWKSYTLFLLDTLPVRLRNNYVKKFNTSMEFWRKTGGGLDEETIRELEAHGYEIRRNGVSNYTLNKKSRIIFTGKIPDQTDDIKSSRDIPSWKRMCFCILKNDHICRFMGFGMTREQQKRINMIRDKYKSVEEMSYGV
ncbi:MAG TPA: phosphoadenosine phosphosulfate sulfurtransferase [Lachnospiraceae bacterium]|nr:phosphoadenosine phosphosulfate sulfurtransferase [Lachnospiraceae bacterium]